MFNTFDKTMDNKTHLLTQVITTWEISTTIDINIMNIY